MALRKLGIAICNFLNHPDNRGRWFDTRAIATAVLNNPWPSAADVGRVGQSLRALEAKGEVVRFGVMAEWKTSKWPEIEPPQVIREVEQRLGPEAAKLLDRLDPTMRRRP